jgi:hypothetical protein
MENNPFEAELRANPAAAERFAAAQLWAFVVSLPEGSPLRRLADELVLGDGVDAAEIGATLKLAEHEVTTLMQPLLGNLLMWQRGGRGNRPWRVKPDRPMLLRALGELKVVLLANLDEDDVDRIERESVATFPADEGEARELVPEGERQGSFLAWLSERAQGLQGPLFFYRPALATASSGQFSATLQLNNGDHVDVTWTWTQLKAHPHRGAAANPVWLTVYAPTKTGLEPPMKRLLSLRLGEHEERAEFQPSEEMILMVTSAPIEEKP